MTANQPPRIATWLLRHFGSGPNVEAIIGDLDERYRQGRPRGWYWREAMLAVLLSFAGELQAHKLLALQALIIGWTVKILWLYVSLFAFWKMDALIRRNNVDPQAIALRLLLATLCVLVCAMTARLVAHVSVPHQRPVVFLYLAIELLALPTLLTSNWHGWGFLFWLLPFSNYSGLALGYVGYFSNARMLRCDSALMALTLLLGSGAFTVPPRADSQQLGNATI